MNVVLPSPEVDVDATAKKTEPFTLGDCRPDYKEPVISPADVTKALCVLLAMAPFFGRHGKCLRGCVTEAVLNSFRSRPFRGPGGRFNLPPIGVNPCGKLAHPERLRVQLSGSTRSKFVQNVRLFSQLRFKAHNIWGLGHDYQSGILWSAYPMKLWALVPCRHRCRNSTPKHAHKKHLTTRGSDPQHERRGPFYCIVKIVITCLTIRT